MGLNPERLPTAHFRRASGFRLIPARHPPIALFEDVASPEEFDAVHKTQSLTNPRLQQELGRIALVPPTEMQLGVPGAGYIMAAFTHLNPAGSRFSDGSYGVYYCAGVRQTAIAETVYHTGRFFAATGEPGQGLDMRCLHGWFSAHLRRIVAPDPTLDPDDYGPGQRLGRALKQAGEDGIVYPSVRHPGGHCYAILRPRCISRVVPAGHYRYLWRGAGFEVFQLRAT